MMEHCINAGELRIGNWLRWKSEHSYPFQAANIDAQNDMILEEMEPIKLFHEILEAAGFEKHDNAYIRDDHIIEEQPDGTFNFLMCKNIEKENIESHTIAIKKNLLYLHQLQNLIFALTGEELNVQIPH